MRAISETIEQPVPRPRRRIGWAILAALGAVLLAYLVAIALPHAHRATCVGNVAVLAQAMRLYSADYNDRIFFGDGDASAPPLVRGQAGQTLYMKQALAKYLPRRSTDSVWYCPADPFARRDFSCDARWSGTFTYRNAGFGYVALPHASDHDPGIRALRRRLLRDYGTDEMRVDHALSSYRFLPTFGGRPDPVSESLLELDVVVRLHRDEWGAYGYWDFNPFNAWVFEEDLPFHFTGGGAFGEKILGKTYGYRDGHASFRTYDGHGESENNYGALINYE